MKLFGKTIQKIDVLKIGVLVVIVLFTSFQKYKVFDQAGGDFEAYRNASIELLSGINPYKYTVKSFTSEEDLRHGYAYLPGLMYVQAPLYAFSEMTGLPIQRVWRFPLLGIDIGVGVLILLHMYKKNYFAALAGFTFWMYHPFFASIGSYTNWEPFPVFFVLLALYFLDKGNRKSDDLSSLFFALSIAFKTFPIVFLPLFLYKTKNKLRFLLIGFIVFVAISLPFMGSWSDFVTYLSGSLLVHGTRELQGRPFLSYIAYYTGINFMQVSLSSLYSWVALLAGSLVPLWLLVKDKLSNKYILALISLAIYFLFTPVMNRTHLIWILPIFVIGIYEIFTKRKYWYYTALLGFYAFYFWYLSLWVRGLRFEGDVIKL